MTVAAAGQVASGNVPWLRSVARFIAHHFVYPVIVLRKHFIWEADLTGSIPASVWRPEQRLSIIGPDRLDSLMTAKLFEFLGGSAAAADLDGVRNGDRLMLVTSGDEYAYYGYIYFDTTRETKRQKRIFGEPAGVPVIGTCYTNPRWRGKRIYPRVLTDAFRYLQAIGYRRATADVDTHNHASNRSSTAAGMTICRELYDWTIFGHLLIQRVSHGGRIRWRLLIV